MTREEYEMSYEAFLANEYPRGRGDPDAYGYPGDNNKGVEQHGTDEPAKPTNVPF